MDETETTEFDVKAVGYAAATAFIVSCASVAGMVASMVVVGKATQMMENRKAKKLPKKDQDTEA